MAIDTINAPEPRPLTTWIEHLKRRRIAAKKARAARKRQRAVTERRVSTAEQLLADIIAGADIVGHGIDSEGYPAAYLLLTLHRGVFDDLATFGAELEDLEDSNDREPTDADNGEPSIDVDTPGLDCCDLGEPKDYQIVLDRTIIDSARERYKPRPEPERVGSLTYATVDPETQRAGMWVIQRRTGR